MGLHDLTFRDVVQKYSFTSETERPLFKERGAGASANTSRTSTALPRVSPPWNQERRSRCGAFLELLHLFCDLRRCSLSGRCSGSLNWRSKPEELRTILELCMPRVMVAEPEFAEMLAELREGCGFVEHWLSTEETKGFESSLP